MDYLGVPAAMQGLSAAIYRLLRAKVSGFIPETLEPTELITSPVAAAAAAELRLSPALFTQAVEAETLVRVGTAAGAAEAEPPPLLLLSTPGGINGKLL
jgi:hypothetical protein